MADLKTTVKAKGGTKLESALASIVSSLQSATTVDVGFLEGATYPDGTSVAMVAAIQEWGAPRAGIPPRPFFRTMIADKSPEWPKAIAQLLRDNKYNTRKTLTQTGAAIAGQLEQSIVDVTAPPLSPVTVMLRKMKAQNPDVRVTAKTVGEAAARVAAGESPGGNDKPLIETGTLLKSVDYVVK